MSKEYYYLVTGLPNLTPEISHLKKGIDQFKSEIFERLSSEDLKQFQMLMYEADNKLLLNALFNIEDNNAPQGVFDKEFMLSEIKDPQELPEYMADFINIFNESDYNKNYLKAELMLTQKWIKYALTHGGKFIKWWLTYQANLRNILTFRNCKKLNLDIETQIVRINDISDDLLSTTGKEPDLNAKIDWYADLIPIYQKDDMLEKERSIDLLSWRLIDEVNNFQYFSLDVLIGYYLKLKIVERWLSLDQDTGREIFDRLVKDISQQKELTIEN
ncbi:MAG: DUF2764 family protein [Hyphomicrobiales bacterium]